MDGVIVLVAAMWLDKHEVCYLCDACLPLPSALFICDK